MMNDKTLHVMMNTYILWQVGERLNATIKRRKEKMQKISMDKKYQTSGGNKVVVVSVNGPLEDFPVTAYIMHDDGDHELTTFTADGHYFCAERDYRKDLIELPKYHPGQIAKTRDGRKVEIFAVDYKPILKEFVIAGRVFHNSGEQALIGWTADGHYYCDGSISDLDLI